MRIGITTAKEWVVERNNGQLCKLAGTPLMFAWPILERRRGDIVADLTASMRIAGFQDSVVATFPYGRLILSALESGQPYWQLLALEWVEAADCSVELREVLQQVSAQGASQQLRHRALATLKKIPVNE